MRFTNKICLVTGGASGIGRATCQRLASEGGNVLMVDINEKAGQEAEREKQKNQARESFHGS